MLRADGQVHGDDLLAEGLLQGGDGGVEVGPLAVQHVAEQDARQAAVFGPAPQTLGLHLDAVDAVDHHERRLYDSQGGDGVGLEAGVAGSVDQVEEDALALDVGEGGREAELAFLLVVVEV